MWGLSFLGLFLVLSVIFCGYAYSRTVGMKHEIISLEESVNLSRVKNAELKNTIFKMTDPQILETIAEEKGLVEDKNPQWVSASL